MGRNKKQLINNLEGFKKAGCTWVKIVAFPGAIHCKACYALDGMQMAIDDALQYLPIPTNCERDSGCRCIYTPL